MARHRLSIAAVVLSAGLGLAAPAHADWSFTRWGMTPEQVIAASRGKATAATGGYGDRIRNMDFRATGGPFTFDKRVYRANFYFDIDGGRGLRVVRLELLDQSQCDALGAGLEKRYGASSNPNHGEWIDKATGDTIFFSKSYKSIAGLPCYLSYSRV
jgi:hypothetical protein